MQHMYLLALKTLAMPYHCEDYEECVCRVVEREWGGDSHDVSLPPPPFTRDISSLTILLESRRKRCLRCRDCTTTPATNCGTESYSTNKDGPFVWHLKSRLNLGLCILQSPSREVLLGNCALDLFTREPFCFGRRVISKTIESTNFSVGNSCGRFAIAAFVDCDDRDTAQAQVLLKAVFGVLDQAVVGPASKVPYEFGALSKARSS